ncbi:MAG: hypothetical protein ACK45H_08770, partial [Bacteroidota bacterium]
MKSFLVLILSVIFSVSLLAQGSTTTLPCGISSTFTLGSNGFSGDNPTSATGSCGQCCYQGSDLDGDGDQDVSFSVENSQWFRYCNSTGSPITISFTVDEVSNNCNLQGAVFVGGTNPNGATDALDIDCSNQEFNEYGSNVNGGADGFAFTGITIPAGGCAYLMVDGYAGASCSGFTINTACPPTCTPPTSFTAGPDLAVCAGSSVTLNSTVSGGTTSGTGLSYSWTPTAGLSSASVADPVATPTSTTTYTMTACNGGPGVCCVTDQVVITVTPNFTANAGPDVTACAPSTITIGGSGGTPTGPAGSTYSWVVSGTNNAGITISGSSTVANPTVTINSGATGSETYQVTVTNGPCVRTDLVTVTVGTLAVNAGPDQDQCVGASLTPLGGTPTAPAGATYTWTETSGDNGQTNSGNVSLSSSTASNPTVASTTSAIPGSVITYTVTATLSGCSNSDQVLVTIRPLPTIPTATASASPICAGQSVTLTAAGGAGSGTYSWWTAASGGTQLGTANTLTVTPTVTTTYYIQSTDPTYGCVSVRGSITIVVNVTPIANAGLNETYCFGSSIVLDGTVTNPAGCSPAQTWTVVSGSGTFSPNANSLTATFTPTAAGTITLRLTPCTLGGCTAVTDDVVFNVTPAPIVTATAATNPICVGLINDLAGTVTGGTPIPPDTVFQTFSSSIGPFTIPDNNTSGVVIPINVSGVSNTTVGTTDIYSVNVNVDHNSIGQVEVWLCPPGATYPNAACVQLLNNSGGNADDLVNTIFSDQGVIDIAAGTAPYTGIYNLTGTNTLNGAGGFDGDPTNGTWTVVVIDNVSNPTQTGTAGQMSITFSTPVTTTEPYTYTWSPTTGLSSSNTLYPTMSTSGFTPPTTITYTLTATDANGCTGSGAVAVNIIGPPTANAGPDQNVCATSATLAGNNPGAGTTGQWTVISGSGTFTNSTLFNTTVTGLASGNNVFQWALTNTCGTASDQATISSSPPSTATLSGGATTCAGQSATLTVNFTGTGPTYDFQYTNGSTNTNVNNVTSPYTFSVSPATTVTYSLNSMNDDGSTCPETVSGTALITVNPVPAVPTINVGAATCSAAGTATISNYVSGQTYTFTPAGPTAGAGGVISGLTTGTSYTVTTSNGSCTSAASASFSIAAQLVTPVAPTITTTAATCSAAGTATISNYVGTQTYTFTPAGPTAGAGGVISGMTAGTSYTVTTSNGSCTSVASASFSIAAQLVTPIAPTITTTAATCAAAGTATISNYVGTQTYTFTPAGPTVGAGGAITGLTFGASYTVSTINGSCTSAESTSFSIAAQSSVPAIPTLTTTAATCAGDGTATVSNYVVTQTYIFTPAGPSVGAGGSVTGMTTGTSYTVVASDGVCSSGSSASFSIAAQLVTPVAPTITTTAATCSVAGTATISNYVGTQTYTFTP